MWQLNHIESLHLLGYPISSAVLRKVIKETRCTADGISDFRNKW
jgi:hypothetical protein